MSCCARVIWSRRGTHGRCWVFGCLTWITGNPGGGEWRGSREVGEGVRDRVFGLTFNSATRYF